MNTDKLRRNLTKSLCIVICLSSIVSFCGCQSKDKISSQTEQTKAASLSDYSTGDEANAVDALKLLGIDAEKLGINPDVYHDAENSVGFQLDMPDEGDTIAVVHTSLGDFKMRFFPNQAPKAVTNFINLAKDNKFDNTTFHRVVKDFIVQGGHCGTDENMPNGTSSYGTYFEDEFCDSLFNIRGAVSMATTSQDSNGSQFFVNQTSAEQFEKNGGWSRFEDMWKTVKTQLSNYKDSDLLSAFIDQNGNNCYNTDTVPEEVRTLYEKYGGNPYLDGAYNAVDRGQTVFAQVFDGMDVIDKIANIEVDENEKPVENVIIETVEITSYSER